MSRPRSVTEQDLAVGLVSGPDDRDDGKGDLERGSKAKKTRPLDIDASGTSAGGGSPAPAAAATPPDRQRRVWPWAAGVVGGLIGLIILVVIINQKNKSAPGPSGKSGNENVEPTTPSDFPGVSDAPQNIQGADISVAISQQTDKEVHVTFSQADRPMTWGAAITALETDPKFVTLLTDTLRNMPFKAFFWECPAVSFETKEQKAFQFVVTDAPKLVPRRANPKKYSEYLDANKDQAVVVFPNLGGDALMVVPTQAGNDPKPYVHIAEFVRGASQDQQQQVFKRLSVELQQRMRDNSPSTWIWVSTHGLGVPWLHLRLDSRPKRYSHRDYWDAKYGLPAAN